MVFIVWLSSLNFCLFSSVFIHRHLGAVVQSDCENTESSKSCRGAGFDIITNYYEEWPDTRRTVEVPLIIQVRCCLCSHRREVRNIVDYALSPDGMSSPMVNTAGLFPGSNFGTKVGGWPRFVAKAAFSHITCVTWWIMLPSPWLITEQASPSEQSAS